MTGIELALGVVLLVGLVIAIFVLTLATIAEVVAGRCVSCGAQLRPGDDCEFCGRCEADLDELQRAGGGVG